jgi:hypothetical protein
LQVALGTLARVATPMSLARGSAMSTGLARLFCALLVITAASSCASPDPTEPSFSSAWGSLWPDAQPPGTTGHAVRGDNWQVQTLMSYSGVSFVSPTLEELRVFDLLDRGLDPQSAITWMNGNGYLTSASYYPPTNVIGFPTEYMAFINGRWDLVLRVGG